jgi:hypothetical protein
MSPSAIITNMKEGRIVDRYKLKYLKKSTLLYAYYICPAKTPYIF